MTRVSTDVGDLYGDEIPIDKLDPCPKCSSYERWWDMANGEHCMYCDPPLKSIENLRKVLKQKPTQAARKHLQDLLRFTNGGTKCERKPQTATQS